ncbi:MAG: DNA primase [Neomegalonema sp.]|nr:DNA primase [Neomegalonema sp.]
MAFPQSFLEELRNRVSVVDVVGRHVTWRRDRSNFAKGDYWACCPFHGEKTPSFHAEERTGRYYCFGCHEGGGAIDFLMKIERLSFPEAVERLAAEVGLPLPAKDPQMAAREAKRKSLTDCTEAAVALFRTELQSPRGAEAMAYLARRGVSAAMIERFEIGLSPERGADALAALRSEGFDAQQLLAADLARPSDKGGPYHPFHGRLMFPIRDPRGRCVGFGGRSFDPNARAKYLNSRETELFSKSKLLYNLGPARTAARNAPLIVAEGYMDVIALTQAGFEAAVAPLGTALTEDQLDLLWKVAPTPVLALDGDRAGLEAARRVADRALPKIGPDRSLSFVLLPEGQDPDDLIKKHGPEAMQAQLDAAAPLFELLWRRELMAGPLDTPERKSGLTARLEALSARIADEGVRKNYFFDFKRKMREHLFANSAPKRGGGPRGGALSAGPTSETRANALAAAAVGASEQSPAWLREGSVIVFALRHPECALRCEADWSDLEFSHPDLEKIRLALLEVLCIASTLHNEEPGSDAIATSEHVFAEVAKRVGEETLLRVMRLAGGRAPSGANAEANEIDTTFKAMIARHATEESWRREVEAYKTELESDGEDAPAVRLYEARRAANLRRSATTNDETAEYSSLLKSFVDSEPWKKKRNRSS